MSKRLQVLLPDEEMQLIQEAAAAEHVSVGEWVRRSLRDQRSRAPARSLEEKLRAIREASKLDLPTCDIEQMNSEIEQGYLSDSSLHDFR
jgi:Ribbon-helix-helix protein, copG family